MTEPGNGKCRDLKGGGREVQQSVVTNFSQDGEITQRKNQRLGKAAKYQVLSLAEQFRERERKWSRLEWGRVPAWRRQG